MKVFTTIAEFRSARDAFGVLGLVPTMGFLHAGHMSLVKRAQAECGAVAVSIFINPTQFAPTEDLARYPRDVPADLRLLREAGADLVFLPDPGEIYPPGFATTVHPGPIAALLEGKSRPGHFAGVATVVAKLLSIVQPTHAYFGQKDAQQCAVIRRMAADLNLSTAIVTSPTIRDADGLALSSRNVYLTTEQRAQAAIVPRALHAAREAVQGGETSARALRALMHNIITRSPLADIDYVSIADPASFTELDRIAGPALALLAVRFGTTRLIDNMALTGEP